MLYRQGVLGFVLAMFLFVPSAAYGEDANDLKEQLNQRQEELLSGNPTYMDKSELSEEERLEYLSLVEDLRVKFHNEYQSVPHAFGDPNETVQSWFRTIDYVKDARVERPLFITDPPQIRAHLEVELTNKKIVRDEMAFYLPIKPQIQLLY